MDFHKPDGCGHPLSVGSERFRGGSKMHLRGRSKPDGTPSHLLYVRTDFCRFALDKERSLGPMLACAFIFISGL